MKKRLCATLALLLMLPLIAACSSNLEAQTTVEETKTQEAVKKTEETVTEEEDLYEYQEIHDKLTWDKINAFPIAPGSNMTTDEMRQLCADFFRFSKTALWMPDDSFSYVRNKSGSKDNMVKGQIYGGMPYIGLASCSIYRLMDWYDEEKGVVDMEEATKNPKYFGNQCSIASHWGWARVINSAKHVWTQGMTVKNGFLRVGPYTYDDSITSFANDVNTVHICEANGKEVMYESYAKLQLADGLVNYTTAGHVIMCTGAPVVVREGGVINPDESYILITDQAQTWIEKTNEFGDEYQIKSGVDKKISFTSLYKSAYLPFTFAEFLGADPCEKTVCTFDYDGGDSISIEDLRRAQVETNYAISDLYANFKDEDGNVVATRVERAAQGSVRSANLDGVVFAPSLSKYCDGKHTVEVVCQLGTGERLTLYTGTLTK